MALAEEIQRLLSLADDMKGTPAGNEANTKAVLIEPLLKALGWEIGNPTKVSREYRVFDGTLLDYALLIDGQPRLFVEAKALGETLDSKQFISQTVNYANNEGVLWCVLTNGLVYRVYKTNEPVSMEQKLLFEVELLEAQNGQVADVAASLSRLRPDAVASGELDGWGEQVFADARVREVLAELGRKPPVQLISLIEERLGQPKLMPELLAASLHRVLTGSRSAVAGGKVGAGKPSATTGKASGKQATLSKDFRLEHHTGGKPQLIVDLFNQLDEFARGLGQDVSVRSRKFYVGYFAGKRSFFTQELRKTKIWVYLNLDPTSGVPWNDQALRDVRQIGHYGMGDTEFNLSAPEQLDEVKALVQLAYERTR